MKRPYEFICPGDECPLRLTCRLFYDWLNEDEEAEEIIPKYNNGKCEYYEQKEYYGG